MDFKAHTHTRACNNQFIYEISIFHFLSTQMKRKKKQSWFKYAIQLKMHEYILEFYMQIW